MTSPYGVLDRERTTTFADNMQLPVHRWFRYPAGYSAQWVQTVIGTDRSARVLDPFVGSGTTVLAAQSRGAEVVGVESQPFVARVARAKLAWRADAAAFLHRADSVVRQHRPAPGLPPAPLLRSCFTPEVAADLLGLRDQIATSGEGGEIDRLLWLAFVAIIRRTSHAGTAPWQYVLPNRPKRAALDVLHAFHRQVTSMAADMRLIQAAHPNPPRASVIQADVREPGVLPEAWATHVICSPPYANNYDYADATRLEQTVLGEITGWADLKDMRSVLVRSCSQATTRYDAAAALRDPLLRPILDELTPVYQELSAAKHRHGGRKAYDDMIVAYFHDLARVWHNLRRATRPAATVCFVIGDSAPYGVHVPVERWLGHLALAAGFKTWSFDKTRNRNTKWKTRKHTVPLHEGHLWVQA